MEGDLPANRHGNLKTASSDQTLSDILLQIKSSKTPVSNPKFPITKIHLLFSPQFSFAIPLNCLMGCLVCVYACNDFGFLFIFPTRCRLLSIMAQPGISSQLLSFFLLLWFKTFVYMHFARQVFDVLPQ